MSAVRALKALQFRQLKHDKLFHPDILSLPVQRRVCHMTLHFAKYAGKLTQARLEGSRELLNSTLVDAFIICLATANIFNKRITELGELSQRPDASDISAYSKEISLSAQITGEDVFSFVADNLTIHTGKMAKAVESLDHLENCSYVDEIVGSLGNIVGIVLAGLAFVGADISAQVLARLNAVERKSIFFEMLNGDTDLT